MLNLFGHELDTGSSMLHLIAQDRRVGISVRNLEDMNDTVDLIVASTDSTSAMSNALRP